MSKEIDLIKCIISEIDKNLYSDFGGNPCISYTPNLKKLLLALDTPEVRHLFENCNNQDQRIAELEEQLAKKEEQVKQLKLDLGMYKSVNEFINNYGIEKAREVLLQSEKTKKQDKIDFAVEQLSQAIKNIKKLNYKDFGIIYQSDAIAVIDNKIEELKKELK